MVPRKKRSIHVQDMCGIDCTAVVAGIAAGIAVAGLALARSSIETGNCLQQLKERKTLHRLKMHMGKPSGILVAGRRMVDRNSRQEDRRREDRKEQAWWLRPLEVWLLVWLLFSQWNWHPKKGRVARREGWQKGTRPFAFAFRFFSFPPPPFSSA